MQRSRLTDTGLLSAYRAGRKRLHLRLAALALLAVAVALISLATGNRGFRAQDLTLLLSSEVTGAAAALLQIRLPRILAALAVGAALSLAGAVMQVCLRNPLASSSTLGVSQGASFGAAFAIVFLQAGFAAEGNLASAIAVTDLWSTTLCAFAGGLTTTAVILALARIARVTPSTMILAGVAMGSMFAAGTAVIQYFADDIRVANIVHWTFGDLGKVGGAEIGVVAGLALVCFAVFAFFARDFNALLNGRETAESLGVNSNALILTGMTLSALLASVCVAFVGTIGFIGLIGPHIARRIVGSDHRVLLPCSAIIGALVLVLAELAARTVLSPVVLPIGAITSFLGAPLFLYLSFKQKGRTW